TTPLINKCIQGQYNPGSTFKVMTAIAALQAGGITERTSFSCGGSLSLGGAVLHCWRKGGHGGISVRDAIKASCDVFFYQAALHTGIDKLAGIMRRFGVGGPTGINLPNEKPGLMPDTDWKRKTFPNDTKFHACELAISGIGQGYVLTTPLQLALMTARLVNGGKGVVPRLVSGPDSVFAAGGLVKPNATPPSLGIEPRHLALVASGMAGGASTAGGPPPRHPVAGPRLPSCA